MNLVNVQVRRRQQSPVCIAGMHRSGTSMVARLLEVCGLFLGPEKELGFDTNNGEPHWENVRFVALNDQILNRLGGSWDNPPKLLAGWEHTPEVEALRSQAKKLIKRLRGQQYWGWKDPRNSLTLPFWRRIVPDLRLVICLRNPLEVSHSIRVRGDLLGIPLFQLWLTYYRELLSAIPPQQRVVTHYQSYFQDPTAELQRVANVIGMEVPTDVINRACAHISADLRHHRIKTSELAAMNIPDEVLALYLKLCREAGPIYQISCDFVDRIALASD
jgi:hypothetical protein